MKRFLSATLLLILTLSMLLTGCQGQKEIQNLEVIEGLKYEYELNESPDFSNVRIRVIYNDGTTKEVDSSDISFGALDTSVAGNKKLDITYGGFTVPVQVTVKGKSVDNGTRELESIEYLSGIPSVVYVGDTVNYTAIKITANYTDGTSATFDAATNSNIKHNGNELSTDEAGTKTLTISFMGKTTTVDITVSEVVITGIEVDADSVDTTAEGGVFDYSEMVVYAVYNNNSRVRIPLNELTVDVPDLTDGGEGKIVTITYKGLNTTIVISSTPATVVSMTITATGYENSRNTIVLGDRFSTEGITATAVLSNNSTKTISNALLTFDIDVSKEGAATLTAIYKDDTSITATTEITVLGISSITIDKESISTKIPEKGEFSVSGIKAIITCSNGTKVERHLSDGITVDTSALNTSVVGSDSYITVSYGGVVSSPLTIVVYDTDISYLIYGVDLPSSITGLDSKKEMFINKDYPYVVGDDNPFIFKLALTIIDDNANLVEGFSEYTSYSKVYLDGILLEGEELAKYVVIDETKNSFDFTEAAVGKTFTITTRPLHGVAGYEEKYTRSLTVQVVDAYNIYEAYELNYLTNIDEFNFGSVMSSENRTQTQIVDDFLKEFNTARPQSLAGVVLHNDLIVKTTDIPKEYFVGYNRSGALWDYLTLFPHATDNDTPSFSFYGNYYTIFTYDIPNVCANGTGNQDDYVSNSQVFRFSSNAATNGSYDHTKYNTYIYNLYMRDNHPNSDNIASANRDMLGVIAMKLAYQDIFVENIRVEAYYISFFVDHDYVTVNVNESIFYNSWQNHIFLFSDNILQADNETPRANYPNLTLNITKSSITKCGGPVIIAQTADVDKTKASKSGASVNIDKDTEIWTYVTGEEAWFKAMSATTVAQDIKTLGHLLKATLGSTYVTEYDENGNTGSNTTYMNIVMVNLMSGTDVLQVIKGTDDLDGKLTIGDRSYLDMNDTYTATHAATGGTVGYGSAGVAQAIGNYAGQAPVFNSYAGGVGVYNGSSLVTDLTADAATNAQNKEALKMGDYIALYQNNMGIVLGYNLK